MAVHPMTDPVVRHRAALDALAAREATLAAATPGPWVVEDVGHRVDIDGADGGWLFRSFDEGDPPDAKTRADAAAIVVLRNTADQVTALLRHIVEKHKPTDLSVGGCDACMWHDRDYGFLAVDWPCDLYLLSEAALGVQP